MKYNANHFKVLMAKINAFLNLELINLEKANRIKKFLRKRILYL